MDILLAKNKTLFECWRHTPTIALLGGLGLDWLAVWTRVLTLRMVGPEDGFHIKKIFKVIRGSSRWTLKVSCDPA